MNKKRLTANSLTSCRNTLRYSFDHCGKYFWNIMTLESCISISCISKSTGVALRRIQFL